MQVEAKLYGAKLSAQKGRLVADLVRGQKVDRALNILAFTPKKGAVIIKKVLESAIANAENNHSLDVDRLVVSKAEVGRAQVMKRFHARGRGRASRIEKWFSHLKIVVAEQTVQAPAAEQEAA